MAKRHSVDKPIEYHEIANKSPEQIEELLSRKYNTQMGHHKLEKKFHKKKLKERKQKNRARNLERQYRRGW